MYTRPLLSNIPTSPVENKKAHFGLYKGRFENFAIKGLHRPFGTLHIPTALSNLRVNSLMRLMFQSETVIGEIAFFVGPLFSAMETTYWNKTTKKKNAYRQLLPPGFIHLPKRLGYNITACRTERRYIRFLSRMVKGSFYADIDFVGSTHRPALEARFDIDFTSPQAAEVSAVTPYFVTKRCEASYMSVAPLSGWLSENYFTDLAFSPKTSVCYFDYRKAYYTVKTFRTHLTGFGFLDTVLTAFQLSSSVAPDSDKYNDNVLFYNGEITPLPSVKITMPYGEQKAWNIQDTEGMVDLTFTPLSTQNRHLSIIFWKAHYDTIFGHFDGTLLTKDGKRICLSGYSGIAKRLNLRF
ncbi:MAG: DUF2804 family protein [Spirochaetaceae bacterium]|nr:DUF2804 family protein [Spirochaetaceae bacterium]